MPSAALTHGNHSNHGFAPEHPARQAQGTLAVRTRTPQPRHLRAVPQRHPVTQPERTEPRSTSVDLAPMLRQLAIFSVEILHCNRGLDHVARWVTKEVYESLRYRQLSAIARYSITGKPPNRIALSCGNVHLTSPAPGVVEAVVMVFGKDRARAVALRLEQEGDRWRATQLNVL